MACGAGLPILAIAVTGGHFVIVFFFPRLARKLPRSGMNSIHIALLYESGKGVLRKSLADCTQQGFSVSQVSEDRAGTLREDV